MKFLGNNEGQKSEFVKNSLSEFDIFSEKKVTATRRKGHSRKDHSNFLQNLFGDSESDGNELLLNQKVVSC